MTLSVFANSTCYNLVSSRSAAYALKQANESRPICFKANIVIIDSARTFWNYNIGLWQGDKPSYGFLSLLWGVTLTTSVCFCGKKLSMKLTAELHQMTPDTDAAKHSLHRRLNYIQHNRLNPTPLLPGLFNTLFPSNNSCVFINCDM